MKATATKLIKVQPDSEVEEAAGRFAAVGDGELATGSEIGLKVVGERTVSTQETPNREELSTKVEAREVDFFYGDTRALEGVSLGVRERNVTALIGPSGCGKSTFLRVLNRMNDVIPGTRLEGGVLIDGVDVYSPDVDVVDLRRRVGMVFQRSNPFPKSIYDNVAYGPRIHGVRERAALDEIVEGTLRRAALWDEVKDRLYDDAYSLSGGQQQRLCIARALAIGPSVLLMDEPTSALDPIATAKIEELISTLKSKLTIVIVTHSMSQASRVSDHTAFLYLGDLIEFGETKQIFEDPKQELTGQYISGRFG